jgi:hypothetical protein
MDEETIRAIIVAVIAATPPTIVALRASQKVDALHVIVNSRLSELLAVTQSEARLVGANQERQEHQDRDARIVDAPDA